MREADRVTREGPGATMPAASRAAELFASEAGQETPGNSAARSSSKKERTKNDPWVAGAFRIFAKVFNAKPITLEQEKMYKAVLSRAFDEDVALAAIDLMFQEGDTYPTGKRLREAIDRVNMRTLLHAPKEPTPTDAVTFREWYAVQDPDMQARVRRVFPSLKVGL